MGKNQTKVVMYPLHSVQEAKNDVKTEIHIPGSRKLVLKPLIGKKINRKTTRGIIAENKGVSFSLPLNSVKPTHSESGLLNTLDRAAAYQMLREDIYDAQRRLSEYFSGFEDISTESTLPDDCE